LSACTQSALSYSFSVCVAPVLLRCPARPPPCTLFRSRLPFKHLFTPCPHIIHTLNLELLHFCNSKPRFSTSFSTRYDVHSRTTAHSQPSSACWWHCPVPGPAWTRSRLVQTGLDPSGPIWTHLDQGSYPECCRKWPFQFRPQRGPRAPHARETSLICVCASERGGWSPRARLLRGLLEAQRNMRRNTAAPGPNTAAPGTHAPWTRI
jgi:hypothetical protein